RIAVGRRSGTLGQRVHPRAGFLTAGMAVVDLLGVSIAVTVVTGLEYSPLHALAVGVGAAVVMTIGIALRGGYRRQHWGVARQDLRALVTGIAVAAAVAVCLAYFGLVEVPQQVLLSAVAASLAMATLLRGVHQMV